MIGPHSSIQDRQPEALLASTREAYSSLPETLCLEPRQLQHVLYSLNYTNSFAAEEAEIAAAIKVARTDWAPGEAEGAA